MLSSELISASSILLRLRHCSACCFLPCLLYSRAARAGGQGTGRGVHTWQQVSQAAAAASWRVCLRAQACVTRRNRQYMAVCCLCLRCWVTGLACLACDRNAAVAAQHARPMVTRTRHAHGHPSGVLRSRPTRTALQLRCNLLLQQLPPASQPVFIVRQLLYRGDGCLCGFGRDVSLLRHAAHGPLRARALEQPAQKRHGE